MVVRVRCYEMERRCRSEIVSSIGSAASVRFAMILEDFFRDVVFKAKSERVSIGIGNLRERPAGMGFLECECCDGSEETFNPFRVGIGSWR